MKGGGFSWVLLQISGSKASNKPQGMKMKAEWPQCNLDAVHEYSVGRIWNFSLDLGPNAAARIYSNQIEEEACINAFKQNLPISVELCWQAVIFFCVNIVKGKYLNRKINKKAHWLEVEWKNEDSWSQWEFCHGFYWSWGLHAFCFPLNVCRELRCWILKPISRCQLVSRKCACVCLQVSVHAHASY